MTVDPATLGLIVIILTALVGALAGTAGFAVLAGRQPRRIAAVLDRMAEAQHPEDLVNHRGIHDPALRASLDALSIRLAATWRLATTDQLTGILSRQAIVERLADELDRAARYGRSVSVVLIDLDHFKRINDTHGHAVGDAVLRSAAASLAASVRSVDAVGRYGGEEFLLILPETGAEDAAAIAEKLRRTIASSAVDAGADAQVGVTMSAGVASGSGGRRTIDTLIRDADQALYAAKSFGRDQIVIHRPTADDGTVSRAALDPRSRAQAAVVGRSAAQAATDVLVAALARRAGGTAEPSTAIAESAATLARSLGLSPSEIERIRAAGLLHDLGDLAIPEEILAHPGELGRDEWRMVAEHPKIGHIILEQAGALRDAADIVLHHHERFDGRGYPHGLSGEEIPIGARIVAVIDAYEAMTSGRPYRPAISHDEAVAELRRQSGTQFDPGVVDAFATLVGAGLTERPVTSIGHPEPAPSNGSVRRTKRPKRTTISTMTSPNQSR